MKNEEAIKELNTENENNKHEQKLDWSDEQMEIREMTDKEIIETLNKLKSYFDSPLFENNRSVINALEVAVEAIENKENSKKLNKTPFDRVNNNKLYCFIDSNDKIHQEEENNDSFDDELYECSNYFNNKDFAKQVMLHQLLYRKLLKFKLERDWANSTTDDNDDKFWYFIDKAGGEPYVQCEYMNGKCFGRIYFNSSEIAAQALTDIVLPFLKEHTDFIWNW